MKVDRVVSVLFFLMAVVLVWEGFHLPYMAETSPGPGFFPLWLGGGIMLLSAILFFTTRRPDRPLVENWRGFRNMLLLIVALGVYTIVLGYLGLLITLALLVIFLVGKVEGKSRRVAVASGVLVSLGCYLVFEAWLGIALPTGVLGL